MKMRRLLYIISIFALITILGILFSKLRPVHYPNAYFLASIQTGPWAFCAEDSDKQWLDCTIGVERNKIFETPSAYNEVERWYQERYEKIGNLQLNKTSLELTLGSEPELIDAFFEKYISIIWKGNPPKLTVGMTPYFIYEKYSLYLRFAYKDIIYLLLLLTIVIGSFIVQKLRRK